MRTEKSLKRIASNIIPHDRKAMTVLATCHKGPCANGCNLVIRILQKF